MGTLVFLPWLWLKDPVNCGVLRFVPWTRGAKLAPDLRGAKSALGAFLRGYVDEQLQPVKHATIVMSNAKSRRPWDFGDGAPDDLWWRTASLFLAATA